MQIEDLSKILAGLGLGSGAGAAITAIINSQTAKGKSRAEAADLLIGAAERVGKMNADLDDEVRRLKGEMDAIQLALMEYLAERMSRDELLEVVKGLRR